MPLVPIDGGRIVDRAAFHVDFAEAFGFSEFYGRNMDAWIDCMSSLDQSESGLSRIHGSASDPVVLRIDHCDAVPGDIFDDLVGCAGFVNWRNLQAGYPAILVLGFSR